MARVLFAMFEGGGNIPLITPVLATVVDRGHGVTVVAGPNIRRPNPGPPSASGHRVSSSAGAPLRHPAAMASAASGAVSVPPKQSGAIRTRMDKA